jgi:hypothetical protein
MPPVFAPIFNRWPALADFARDVGCPAKTAREWVRNDSIPSAWFAAVVRAALSRGFPEITADYLAVIAERRRLARAAIAAEDAEQAGAAA